MRQRIGAALMAALAASALGLVAAPPEPVAWKVESTAPTVKAGGTFTVKLLATIQDGWHVYSMKPLEEGPIPTRVWVAEGQPFSLAGPVKADEPQTVMDATLHAEVELYEGPTHFEVPVQVGGSAAPGAQKMVVSVSYQSCNNHLCLPPKTVKVEVPVTVTK